MAKIHPFQGIHYNTNLVPDLAAVVTPPYDVIGPEDQKRYYQRSPFNCIRLELGYRFPEDNQEDNRYLRAARDYRNWLDQGILIQDPLPLFYLYEQEFQVSGSSYRRTGFFARVELEDYTTGTIKPHEETLSGPKADRLALMEACAANFSSIFAFYNDPAHTLEPGFNQVKENPPEIDITDEAGEHHRLWFISSRDLQQKAVSLLANQELFIADGHHRYETALNFYHSHRKEYPGANSLLTMLVNTSDPGLVVLPTHRILHHLPDLDPSSLMDSLLPWFTVKAISYPDSDDIPLLLSPLKEAGQTAFICCSSSHAWLLTLRSEEPVQKLNPHHSRQWCSLDVSVLQTLVFQEALGISLERITQQSNLTYTRDRAEALDQLKSGKGQLAFFLNPTGIREITGVAAAGDKMPQKSTYFYPKLLTGLIINDLRR